MRAGPRPARRCAARREEQRVSILEISVTAGQDGRGLVRRGGCDDRRRAEQGAGRPGLRCRPAPGRGPGRAAVRRFGDNPGAGAGQPRAEGPARVLELGARSRSWPGPPGTGRLEPGGDRRSARQWPGRPEPADPMPGLRGAPVTAEIPRARPGRAATRRRAAQRRWISRSMLGRRTCCAKRGWLTPPRRVCRRPAPPTRCSWRTNWRPTRSAMARRPGSCGCGPGLARCAARPTTPARQAWTAWQPGRTDLARRTGRIAPVMARG